MDIAAYRDEIKFELTGGVIKLEISDDAIDQAINKALREVQRYIDSTTQITLQYSRCIDMKPYHVSTVTKVRRAKGFLTSGYMEERTKEDGTFYIDPMYASMWSSIAGGYTGIYNSTPWIDNIAAYNTTMQIANTLSTDMYYEYKKAEEKLYVNCAFNIPQKITIEYIPTFEDVSQVTSNFWIDIIQRMALAFTKVAIGRIRTKYTLSNSLWQLDANILEEGNAELAALRDQLRESTQLTYPID